MSNAYKVSVNAHANVDYHAHEAIIKSRGSRMNTLALSQKLLSDVMWRLPKEDWGVAEAVAWRLEDLHFRVKMLEGVLRVEKEYHVSRGEVGTAQVLQEILDDEYMRGKA